MVHFHALRAYDKEESGQGGSWMEHSFSPEQLRRVLGSAEGRQLLALLSSGGGERLRQAADAAKQGDHARAMELLRPVLSTEQAQSLLRRLNG